jgi:tRNA-dihydrouridine synthase
MSNPSPETSATATALPWPAGTTPLMLAPMQGVTNRATRALLIDWVQPDVLFTEFMRVNAVGRKRLAKGDLRDVAASEQGVPLVVQLVGHGHETLSAAAQEAQTAGAVHINLNLGCPYGRMTTSATGGKLLQHPAKLERIIPELRRTISGTFSIKLRAGYDDPAQIFDLLPLLEAANVDFLVLHPRTVLQEYAGHADHAVTTEVIAQTDIPVIANGDIRTAAEGQRILRETGAAGLMLGRGAISDPLLFERLRGLSPEVRDRNERAALLRRYLHDLLGRYHALFCGDAQILSKIKGVVLFISDPDFDRQLMQLRKAKNLQIFTERVDEIG